MAVRAPDGRGSVKFVTFWRPLPPQRDFHDGFDWRRAIALLRESVARTHGGAEVVVITVPGVRIAAPRHRYRADNHRLMLWLLEAAAQYCERDLDDDTIMVSPDMLVAGDLTRFFGDADYAILARPAAAKTPLLNGAQWWRADAAARLASLFRAALSLGERMPKEVIAWGADTAPLVDLLAPVRLGRICERHRLRVRMLPASRVMHSVSQAEAEEATSKGWPSDRPPLLDFKGPRKAWMPAAAKALRKGTKK